MEKLASAVHQAYLNTELSIIDKEKIKVVIQAFYRLYQSRTSTNEEGYYRSNLISSGLIQGTREEVLGTVDQAVERSIKFIDGTSKLEPHQGEIFSRNLIAVKKKESFSLPLEVLLKPFIEKLKEISKGNL